MKTLLLSMVVLSVSCLGQTYFVQGPAEPKPYEQTAIRELADYLARRINGTLSIGGHSPVTLQVGDTDLAREQHCLSTELEDERWVIRSVGDQVLLNGGGTRGALYAVYHFLEDHCGIHWWSDFEDDVPEASPLALEALDATGKPAFAYRDIYRTHRRGIGPLTALRNRLNRDGDEPIPMALGGSFTYGSPEHVHTFDKYVPFAEFGSSHPEYFSLRGGQRVGGQTAGQLCLTNPELKNLILKRMLAYIEADQKDAAEHGKPMPRIYDLSMNDNLFPCECEACKAEAEKYNPSGFYLNFVNSIAREVGKSHPEVFISTLAYYFTEEPPKQGVRAEDNVIVKLCDTKTNEAASILEPDNRVMLDFLRQWQNHAKNLFVWDYAIVFTVTGFPFASEFTYGELYRTYHENNVTGIFWEHEYPFEADFYELKYFLEAKLAEDPEQDADALMRLFMDRYYQEAGPFLLSYRRLLDQQRKARQGYISWFPPASAFFHLSNHALKECQALFDQAEAAVAAKPRIWARVRHARAGLDRLTCVKKASAPIFHGAAAGNAESPLEPGLAAAAFERLRTTRDSWVEQWPAKDLIREKFATELEACRLPEDMAAPPVPRELENRSFYDFPARRLEAHAGDVTLVDAPESPVGKAMRSDVDANAQKYYDLPLELGFYDVGNRKSLGIIQFDKPVGSGYNWYRLPGTVRVPKDGTLYLTRAWTTQLRVAYPELIGRDFEVWASVKFTGPKFLADSTDKNYVFVDRVALVLPEGP